VEFCGRNLSDTGYISKCVLNIVRNDFGSDNIKINIVNGKFTRMIHKSFKIDKDK
jgi:CRISPR/Cas system Type II protein with McrA/HNH and RuvC-like nuclease domain